jgi:DNA-directed RNA polymerase specialized sigma24 family protein
MLTPMNAISTLADQVRSQDPAEGLRSVAALRRLVETLEVLHVDQARAQGWSWQDVADALGVTKQTVHRKHRGR